MDGDIDFIERSRAWLGAVEQALNLAPASIS